MSHTLTLSPGGHLFLEPDAAAEPRLDATRSARLTEAFGNSGACGLELLVSALLQEPLPPVLGFWRNFARRYFTRLCHLPDPATALTTPLTPPDAAEWDALIESAPPMKGLEYLDPAALTRLWDELDDRVRNAAAQSNGGLAAYLQSCHPLWNAVGRVTFHLAENKRNPAMPFAFLATYTHRVSEQGKVQHLPLARALEEYAGAKNRTALTALLLPVQRAADQVPLIRELLDSRGLFHPQVWTPVQAYAFLQAIPRLEQSGLVVRIPDWWKAGRPPRPQVSVRIGEAAGGRLNRDSLLNFQVGLALDGEPLTAAEAKALLQNSSGLALLKGKWVEVDRDKLKQVLDHWHQARASAGDDGVTLLEGMRLLAGFRTDGGADATAEISAADWSQVVAGKGLRELLESMQAPGIGPESDPGPALQAQLRPYQRQGAHWLWFMNQLGLGACLADDMGLGKTIQILSLLLVLQRRPRTAGETPAPSLLVAPASLLANWRAEAHKFAPSLRLFFAHPAETAADSLTAAAKSPQRELAGVDLVVTSYSMAMRLEWLKAMNWNVVILDEAQAIKNAGSRQSRAVKELRGRHRIALSGTPIENRLSDLWSLFDFICPGLLGGAKDFGAYVKNKAQGDAAGFAPLRRLVRPYILRRLKTDKRIISDLPEKTEIEAFCPLTRHQAALYQQSVTDLAERLESADGIQRRGIILAFLTRFKQICNHPSQWLADGQYAPADSGKFQRLREVCETVAARQEKVLVFTQYREMTEPLSRFLAEVFGRTGLVLHGGTPVAQRQQRVDAFQRDGGPPFFVLSLKAGGTGLNLTAAAQVIHFDRWWNPAVENQATDRAFRIGQKANVMVHKFICRGTLEERIHELIAGKSALAENILGEGAERLLTEMNNAELLRFVALDINTAADE